MPIDQPNLDRFKTDTGFRYHAVMRRLTYVLRYWGPVVIWAGLIAYLSHIPSLATGAPGAWDLVVRKIGHIGEYAVLAYLLWRALRAHRFSPRQALVWSGLLALAFAASDEFHQSFIPGREGAVRDVLIDTVGIGVGLLGWRIERRIPFRSLAGRKGDN